MLLETEIEFGPWFQLDSFYVENKNSRRKNLGTNNLDKGFQFSNSEIRTNTDFWNVKRDEQRASSQGRTIRYKAIAQGECEDV